LTHHIFILDCIHTGESNAGNGNNVKYACLFSKMIQSWREIWNQRTSGITDVQFPFGFVQVGLVF
jgi:hypothetical protein